MPATRSPTRATVFHLPDGYSDAEAAPLLCAGLIGYRSLKMTGDAKRLGLYGFGAAAHIVAQVAQVPGTPEVFAFTRPGDTARKQFALRAWRGVGGRFRHVRPKTLDAAIIFAPVGELGAGGLEGVRAKEASWCAAASI